MSPAQRRRPARGTGPASGPVTERGRQTRALLVRAARKVFERDGYLDARITDITAAAGVSHGTFYTHFDSKEDVFREVVFALTSEMFPGSSDGAGADVADPVERIRRANQNFVRFYRANSSLLAIFEQVATFNGEFTEIRRRVRDRSVRRAEEGIRRLQAEGVADPGLDPHLTASALVSMVSNFVYSWLVLGEPHEEGPAIDHLTTLWARAIGLDPDRRGVDAPQAVGHGGLAPRG